MLDKLDEAIHHGASVVLGKKYKGDRLYSENGLEGFQIQRARTAGIRQREPSS